MSEEKGLFPKQPFFCGENVGSDDECHVGVVIMY